MFPKSSIRPERFKETIPLSPLSFSYVLLSQLQSVPQLFSPEITSHLTLGRAGPKL